jgi:WD40 repeat protein
METVFHIRKALDEITDSFKQEGKSLVGHSDSITSVHFCKEGSYIASSSLDGTIRIWDLFPKVPFKVIGRARYIPFDSHDIFNNYQLQIDGCKVKITNSQNGDVVYVLMGHTRLVKEARFSLDGSKIVTVSCDGCAKIWDAHTGKQIGLDLTGHLEYPHTAAFSPDGLLLITASKTEIKIWDVNSNIQLGPDITFWDPFYKVEFSQDGRNIITETENDYDLLIEWEPLQELINKTAEQMASRHFTELEKKKYYIE